MRRGAWSEPFRRDQASAVTADILNCASRPVSRVLYGLRRYRKRDGHSSGTAVTGRLKQPTRATIRRRTQGAFSFEKPLCRPYSVLLPVGLAVPLMLPSARCALTAPFHPYRRRTAGGLFSVALSLGSPPPDVIRHRVSMEPGLSSASREATAIRPAGIKRHRRDAPAGQSSSVKVICRKCRELTQRCGAT
jgi:hypothetical protein